MNVKSVLLFFLFGVVSTLITPNKIYAQRLKSLRVGFQDNLTVKGKVKYYELTDINDESLPFKPAKLEIYLTFNGKRKSISEKVEILIEELFEPTELNKFKSVIKSPTWIPHKVVHTTNTFVINGDKLILKGVDYKTAGFSDSMLYIKSGFRIVALYYDEKTNDLQKLEKEYLYSE
jgi:hypothetical protein